MANRLTWILVAWFGASLAVAQDRTQLMSEAALRENWSQVAGLAGSGEGLTPVERLLEGHAELALNRNNESLADFLTVTTPSELMEWREWAGDLRAKNPNSAMACYFEGDALARLRDWPAAIQAFDAALKLAPGHAMLLNARGVSFAATWDIDRALVDLTAATRSNPRLADAFVSLGSIWAQQQRGATGATRALDKALALSPDSAVALILRGGVRMVQGDLPAAREDVEQASKQAGRLTPALQIRLLDMVELLRNRPENEIRQALASGVSPGMLINRELENLQTGQPGSVDNLMTIGHMFPDQMPAISNGIRDTALANPTALSTVNAGLARLSQLDMLTTAAGSAADLTRGPQYALQTAFSASARGIPVTGSQTAPPRVDFAALSNNLNTAATLTQATRDMMPDDFAAKYSKFSLGVGALSQGLSLFGAVSADLDASNKGNFNFFASHTFEQLGNTSAWALTEGVKNLATADNYYQSLNQHMPLLSPFQDMTAAVASQVGRGSWLPDDTERTHWLNAAQGLQTADFTFRFPTDSALAGLSDSARFGWSARFGALTALPDLADFASSHLQRGLTAPITVNEATSLTDAFAKGTAYSAAFMLTGGNTTAASAVSTAAGVAANAGREWSMPLFQYAVGAQARAQMTDQWSQAVASGRTADTFTNWMGGRDAALSLGYSPSDLSNLDGLVVTPRTSSFPVTQSRPLPPAPPATPANTVTPSDLRNFIDTVKQSIGSGAGPSVAPGGFRTGIAMPYWEDGEWPITPWYGLGYIVNDRPESRKEPQ